MTPPVSVRAKKTHRSALGALHLAVLLFGLAGLFGKWLALPATVIVFGRTIVAAVALAGVVALTRQSRQRLRGFEWPFAAMGALLALHWFAFFRAIQLSTVAVGLLGFASFPVFVLIVETTLLQMRRGISEWALAGVVLAGLVLLVPAPNLDNSIVQGLLWGIVAGLTFAALTVANRLLALRRSASEIALWQTSSAAICLLPTLAFAPVALGARDVALLLILGVVCTALAHTLFVRSMQILSAHTASVVVALEPVYGIALAVVFLHEVPDLRTWAGAGLIVGAALATTLRTVKA
jgi:drug/metabolite transporter (DMT)-like permease